MRPDSANARRRAPAVLILLTGLILSACSGGGPAATQPATGPSTGPNPGGTQPGASSGPVATGPATFHLTATGDPKVTGSWGASFGITCDNPTFAGLDIIFFAQAPDQKAVVLVTLRSASIEVSERAGQGATYVDREFQGSGVATFNPATGATFDSDLTDISGAGGNHGDLGTLKHVSGSIDCGGQMPGGSTVTTSGATADGPVSGPFTSFRVACNASANGDGVSTTAIVTAGTNPTLLIISLPPNHKATIFSVGQSPTTSHSYAIDPAGALSTIATGAHVDADFVEVLPAGAAGPVHRIHLAGDLTCGTFNTSA